MEVVIRDHTQHGCFEPASGDQPDAVRRQADDLRRIRADRGTGLEGLTPADVPASAPARSATSGILQLPPTQAHLMSRLMKASPPSHDP
jgi:hypothetical protein